MRSALAVATLLALLGISLSARAGTGMLEINQTCAGQTGCFSGDTPGFPVTITPSAGASSFRLSSDLTVVSATVDVIVISAPFASLDLAGFRIQGSNSCSGVPTVCAQANVGDGVSVSDVASVRGVSVSNGEVRGMAGLGIALGDQASVRGVKVGQSSAGIRVGEASLVIDTIVTDVAGDGIELGQGALASHASAARAGGDGITAGEGSLVVASPVADNAGTGISLARGIVADSSASGNGTGIAAGCCGVVTGTTASGNAGNGIVNAGLLIRCAAVQNGDSGIVDSGGNLLVEITSRDNATGVQFGGGTGYRSSSLTSNTAVSAGAQVNIGEMGLNNCTNATDAQSSCPGNF